MHDLKIFRALFSDSIYVSETPNGIVYAMTLSTILKLYLLRYTPLANFPLRLRCAERAHRARILGQLHRAVLQAKVAACGEWMNRRFAHVFE